MIKFQYIIHKETGTVIKYEDWKEKLNKDFYIIFTKGDKFKWSYKPKEMLFANEFEIIYNSEFTYKEIESLYLICVRNSDSCENLTLKDKLLKQLNNKYYSDNPKIEKISDNLNKIYKANGIREV